MIEQSIVMDSGTARASDNGADQGVLRMDQEERYFSRRAGMTKIEKQTIVDR